MPKAKRVEIEVPGRDAPVSGLFASPPKARAVMALAHGAGVGMTHEFMEDLAQALAERKIATLRFQFPYMEDGKKRPDPPAVATKAVAAAAAKAHELLPKLPLFAGGKSFGGRMATTAAANGLLPDVRGIVLFGFPLHPPKKPAVTRAAHLADVDVPMLFLQGTRDDLADLKLIKQVTRELERATLHVIDQGDHSFGVLKKSGRTPEDVMDELAEAVSRFV